MKSIDSPSRRLYKSMIFIFGIPFFTIGVYFFATDGNWAFLFNGALWIIIGSVMKIKSLYNKYKLDELKNNGISYDGQVVEIVPYPSIKIGSYITARLKCTYESGNGALTVTSGFCLLLPLDRIENLRAKIYFDADKPKKYIVELFRLESSLRKVD